MSSPVSRIALSAALSVAALAAPVVHADDASPEAPPPKEDAGVHQPGEEGGDALTTGDDLLIELTIDALVGAPGVPGAPGLPKECKWQCCHTVWP